MPNYGSESPDNPSNYRGISISSCLDKLFTSVTNNRIIEFVHTNHLIEFNQTGFHKGYRTAAHVFVMETLIDSCLNKGKNCTYALLILPRLTTLCGEKDCFTNC